MRIVFIEDDELLAEALIESVVDSGGVAYSVDNALDANKINADYYIFDMSAIGGLYAVHSCWSPIANIANNHPGASIGILTAYSEDVISEVIDKVEKETGRKPVYIQTGRNCLEVMNKAIFGEVSQ